MDLKSNLLPLTEKLLELGRFPRLVVLTGAGISAESGIRTFRDQNGLWENNRIEDVATPEAFIRNPTMVHRFYNARRKQALTCMPNPGHVALVELEKTLGAQFSLITQNVDNLHEKAGSTRLWHMHGELLKARCADCQSVCSWQTDLDQTNRCERCGGPMRPHIVWFGEIPLYMEEIMAMLERCDLFVAIGTSGQVYPAAGFFEIAASSGAFTIELNLTQTGGDFDLFVPGPASQSVPALGETIRHSIREGL